MGAPPRGVVRVALVAGAAVGGLFFVSFVSFVALARWPALPPPVLVGGAVLLMVALLAVALFLLALLAVARAAPLRADAVRRDRAAARAERAAANATAETGAIASVAHDIRSPLVTVHSYLELLADDAFGPLPAEASGAACRATDAAGRAQSLVEEALREQALHAATRSLELAGRPAKYVDLRTVVREVIGSLEAELAAARAEVEMLDLPPVRGNDSALYRVFANLLQNAVKYGGPSGSPRIVVSGAVEDGRCEIAVHEWGVGIPTEEQERVFEPRVRGESGTGMGLSTVRSLLAQQSGRVWVDPAVTDGACIRLSLPAV